MAYKASRQPQTVLCLKWEDRYGPEYVNRLRSMVERHTNNPTRVVCFTDDPTGIEPGVDIKPMPEFTLPEVFRRHPFRRMFIFDKVLEDLEGNVLHLDLDLVVTGNLDDFFSYRPEQTFCVAENWTQMGKGVGNMSVFRFKVGAHPYIYEMFKADPMAQRAKYRNSQTFVSRNISEIAYWPASWCLSFKHSLLPAWPMNFWKAPKLPRDAKIVAFTGKPDIDEAARGEWPVKNLRERLYKHVCPTPWLNEHWR